MSGKTARRTADVPSPVGAVTAWIARVLYSLAWYPALPLAIGYVFWRSRRQPEYRKRIGERLGIFRRRTDDAPLIWLHAVSVGETRAAQPLVHALLDRYPSHRLLLTHMTPTGLETGRELFGSWMREGSGAPPRVAQAMLPWDLGLAMSAFHRAWRPDVGIVMETELWPNLVAQARRHRVPLALVSARLSERSMKKGIRFGWLIRPALAELDVVLAQTDADAQRLRCLGRDDAPVVGNLKFDVHVDPQMEALGNGWRRALLARGRGVEHREVVLVASSRDGEEALLLDAWIRAHACDAPVATTDDDAREKPLLVIVPRHPQRFDEIAAAIESRGLRLARRSHWVDGTPPETARSAEVLLGDSMGEMFAWYALADLAIIGGSLLPFGGQNLIEGCAAGVPLILGPHMFNFDSAAAQAIIEDAAVRVRDADGAIGVALRLLDDDVERQSMGERASAFAIRHRGATMRTLQALVPLIAADASDRRSPDARTS